MFVTEITELRPNQAIVTDGGELLGGISPPGARMGLRRGQNDPILLQSERQVVAHANAQLLQDRFRQDDPSRIAHSPY
jgi:hypothetical protein